MAAEAAALAADPQRAEAARRSRKICQCKAVDVGTIEDAIRASALITVEDVGRHTQAGSGCGACSTRIEEILAATPNPPVATDRLPVMAAE
ncbi:MAG: (2Fe-2S)-binding protein [Azospirillaceae bacterium]|nr:(2Fe-2S)-binding protein [Azospirillaceae bacterium]